MSTRRRTKGKHSFDDTRRVINSRKSEKDEQNKDQKQNGRKDKQRSMKNYTEN